MSDKPLENPPETEAPQEDEELVPVDWVTFPVAVPRDFKRRIHRAARRQGLTASAWARTLLMDAVSHEEREVA